MMPIYRLGSVSIKTLMKLCVRCGMGRGYTFSVCLITKTCLYNFDPLKPHFYIVKLGFTGVCIIFLISAKNIDCGYSLEPPRRGGSNEYPLSMFWAEIWTRGPRATTRSSEWNHHCRYADDMQHFSNTLMTRQWLKLFLKYLAYKVKMLKFSKRHK